MRAIFNDFSFLNYFKYLFKDFRSARAPAQNAGQKFVRRFWYLLRLVAYLSEYIVQVGKILLKHGMVNWLENRAFEIRKKTCLAEIFANNFL